MRLVALLQQLRDFSAVDVAAGLRRAPSERDAGSYAALEFQSAKITALSELDAFCVSTPEEIPAADEHTEAQGAIMLRPYAMQTATLKTKDLSGLSDTPPLDYAAAA